MILLAIILFLTVLEAMHEGLKLRTDHVGYNFPSWLPGAIEMVKLTGMVVIILFLIKTDHWSDYTGIRDSWKFWGYLVPQFTLGWIFIRYAIFDYIYNLCAGLSLDYIGKTKLYDQFWRWALRKQYIPWVHFWSRLIFILAGISLVLKI
jgi:hypothetical protein